MLERLIEISKQAGAEILKVRASGQLKATEKADHSPVTEADLASNNIIMQALAELTDERVISEESAFEKPDEGENFWLVDPLDGTKDFLAGRDEFTVNIARIVQGTPVLGVIYAPVTGEAFYAQQGQGAFKNGERIYNNNDDGELSAVVSRMHSCQSTLDFIEHLGVQELKQYGSSLKLCRLAEGKVDVYPRFIPTHEWDLAAGHAILLESGCRLLDINSKEELAYNKKDFLNGSFIAMRTNLEPSIIKFIN